MNALDLFSPILAHATNEAQVSLSVAGIAAVSLIVGAIMSLITALLVARSQRQDRYNFALIEKRFKVNQKCYQLAERMADVYDKDDKDDEKKTVLEDAGGWILKNNLYLSPSVREKFNEVKKDVQTYQTSIEATLIKMKAADCTLATKETAHDVLIDKFNNVKDGLQDKLVSEVDGYFWKRMK